MSNSPGRAVGGSFLGGIVGGSVGVITGGFLGPIVTGVGYESPATGTDLDSLFEVGHVCFVFFTMLLGAGIGGLIGAIGGSALGAGVATRSGADEGGVLLDAPSPEDAAFPLSQESTETELARLKARMAELEERKRQENAG